MQRSTFLSDKEKGLIEAFKGNKLSICAISKELNRSRDVITRHMMNLQQYETQKLSNTNCKLIDSARHRIVRGASQGQETASQLKLRLDLPISKRRVQHVLSNERYLSYQKVQKVLLLFENH